MARRKKKKVKTFFSSGSRTRKKRIKTHSKGGTKATLRTAGIIIAVVCAGALIVFGLIRLNDYVVKSSDINYRLARLELINYPQWMCSALEEKITAAVGGKEFPINDTIAETAAQNLAALEWLYDVQVQTTEKTLQVRAKYREPVGLIETDAKKYYLCLPKPDDPLYNESYKGTVVLDYIPIDSLATIKIKEIGARSVPPAGAVMHDEDIVCAVELLAAFSKMDKKRAAEGTGQSPGPLLYQLDSVDISNHQGRKKPREPHVIICAKDGTEIWWGAAYGQSQQYLESVEWEKVANLYSYYKQHGTVNIIGKGLGRYIDLREPRFVFPRPQ